MPRKGYLIILTLIFVLTTLFLFLPFKQVIAFSYEDKNQLLAFLPLTDEKTFQIKYTHSIHLSDVIETYQLSGKKIKQIELEYGDFAVGMPANSEGNERFEIKNGVYHLTNMNRMFPFIDLRIGQVRANHQLIYKTNTYTLSNEIKPGTWIRISLKRLSLWQQLKGVNLNG